MENSTPAGWHCRAPDGMPGRSTPAAGTAAVATPLEQLARAAWPALVTIDCHGWQLRWAHGYTKRSNSAAAITPHGEFATVLPKAEAFYRERGQPPAFRITPLAGPEADAILASRGYRRADPTRVMTLALDERDDARLSRDAAAIDSEGPEEWLRAHAASAGLEARERAAHAAIVAAIAPDKRFGVVRNASGAPCAFGMAVVDGTSVGLFNLLTGPAHRRRGLGRRLVEGLLASARGAGVRRAWLQVAADNRPAVALYESLGFVEAYRYHYRLSDDPGRGT